MSRTICYSRVVRCNVDNLKMQIMQTKPDHFDRKITNNNLLDWIVSIVFFIHLKLELPTQFLASNVIKIFLFILNIHLLNYLTNWPSTTNCIIYFRLSFWFKICLIYGRSRTRVKTFCALTGYILLGCSIILSSPRWMKMRKNIWVVKGQGKICNSAHLLIKFVIVLAIY